MKAVELIMVSADNNNKFYRMVDTEDGYFDVEYGRVGVTSIKERYPISRWDSKYREKIKKGYKDVSDLKITVTEGKIVFNSTDVEHFYKCFSKYTKENVGRNYTSSAVTRIMVDTAQNFINEMITTSTVDQFNKYLLEVFKVLPRKIVDVRQALLRDFSKKDEYIKEEQDMLDALSSQIITNYLEKDLSLEDLLGIRIESIPTPDWVQPLVMSTNTSRYKPYKIYKITHLKRAQKFDDWVKQQSNSSCELLIHGTRNPNILSILKYGLILRPTNAVISGAAYGNGIYHSSHSDKSLNYTGYDSDKIFLIQNVHMGNPYVYSGWYKDGKGLSRSQMHYQHLKSIGHDSLYVKPGDGLRNSEYIVYNEDQTVTEYLIWLQ